MKPILSKVGRFFWSWGFLKFVLWMVTIVVFICVEEDWRGAHAWAATKAEWEAKGISFDPQAYFPPSIPDDQNLGALPLFKWETGKTDGGVSYTEPIALQKATRTNLPGNNLPSTGNWQAGKLPDKAKMAGDIASSYTAAFKMAPGQMNTLAQLDALYPFISDLRDEAQKRPLCRLDADYNQGLPWGRPLGLLTGQIKVSRLLMLHAVLALEEHQPDLALADIKINFELIKAVQQDPTLVAGLVGIGMMAIGDTAIYFGLAEHAWNDAQLAELEDELGRVDFLKSCQFSLRGEAITQTIPGITFLEKNRDRKWAGIFKVQPDDGVSLYDVSYVVWLDGWLDQNKSRMVAALLSGAETADPSSHRVLPVAADGLQDQAKSFKAKLYGYAPWNIFYTISAQPLLNAVSKFAEMQVWVDETRIACALERYRLTHGGYPDSLDALVPDYIAAMPCDIINGEPYRYRVQPDGTFQLYSVGWNRVDDGGKVVPRKDVPGAREAKEGDWIWPTPVLK